MRRSVTALAVLSVTALADPPPADVARAQAAAPPFYTVTDLGDLGGGFSQALGMNEVGQVVGQSRTAGGANHAFLWDPASGMVDLGDLPGGLDRSQANDVNDRGEVAGTGVVWNGQRSVEHAFYWSSAGGMVDLGDAPGGQDYSHGWAIDATGRIVGATSDGPALGSNEAFVWDAVGGMRTLAHLGTVIDLSRAFGLSERGEIVGESFAAAGSHAVRWDPTGAVHDLGDLPGGTERAWALDTNEQGQVVGRGQTATGPHAFLWDAATGMVDLGAIGGTPHQSVAQGINNHGQIVGQNAGQGVGAFAFLWQAGVMHDLNALIDPADPLLPNVHLGNAYAINDAGQIVGAGNINGLAHGFLLTRTSTDGDGDGVDDDEDRCPASNLSATVVIGGCDSGVSNAVDGQGCSILDYLASCGAPSAVPGVFTSCIAGVTNDLVRAGALTGRQRGAIQSCAVNGVLNR